MKKIVLIALLLVTVSAHAQFHFGFKGGTSITKSGYSKYKAGWYIGPIAEFTFPIIRLGIDASAVYHQTNYSYGDEKTKSIEIPVRLKYSFGLGSTLGGFIAAGPQLTYLLDDNYCNDFATSLNTAIGVKLFKHFQVEARYLFPLGRTFQYLVLGGSQESGKVKRKGWQLSLAYFF